MKIFTSYFYKIRFMKRYQIPISSCCFDPKWFHDFKGPDYKFIDKNGVLNGLRVEDLHPGHQLDGTCHGRPCPRKPESCEFLKGYREQIFSLDKNNVLKLFNNIGKVVKIKLGFSEEPEFMVIVHEDPTNPCSERVVLQDYFNCKEWENK